MSTGNRQIFSAAILPFRVTAVYPVLGQHRRGRLGLMPRSPCLGDHLGQPPATGHWACVAVTALLDIALAAAHRVRRQNIRL